MIDPAATRYTEVEIELGRALTLSIAPDEASFYDDVVAAASSPSKGKDHTLGFGVPGEIAPITTAIILLSKPILSFIWENARGAAGQLIKGATDQVRLAFEKRIADWIQRRFQKPSPIEVSPEKLEAFLETVKQQTLSIGLDEKASVRVVGALRECFKH